MYSSRVWNICMDNACKRKCFGTMFPRSVRKRSRGPETLTYEVLALPTSVDSGKRWVLNGGGPEGAQRSVIVLGSAHWAPALFEHFRYFSSAYAISSTSPLSRQILSTLWRPVQVISSLPHLWQPAHMLTPHAARGKRSPVSSSRPLPCNPSPKPHLETQQGTCSRRGSANAVRA